MSEVADKILLEQCKDCYTIASDICRMACKTAYPRQDLVYLIKTCKALYDMHTVNESNEMGKIVMGVETVEAEL